MCEIITGSVWWMRLKCDRGCACRSHCSNHKTMGVHIYGIRIFTRTWKFRVKFNNKIIELNSEFDANHRCQTPWLHYGCATQHIDFIVDWNLLIKLFGLNDDMAPLKLALIMTQFFRICHCLCTIQNVAQNKTKKRSKLR